MKHDIPERKVSYATSLRILAAAVVVCLLIWWGFIELVA